MRDYVDKYCEVLQSQFKERMRLTHLETQITANGFSSLTEVSLTIIVLVQQSVAHYFIPYRLLETGTYRWA